MKNVLVAGGAGFIGANLCRRLAEAGCRVTVIDNFSTGKAENLEGLPLKVIEADVCSADLASLQADTVVNLACPASPPAYQKIPVETLMAGSLGVKNLLDFSRRSQARFVQASTSEVYGEPLVHPQNESYRGNVSPIGPRSMYDESKRFAEALIMAYINQYSVNAGIVRIFNTYGPFMRPDDGRVVSNFLTQALSGQSLTVYGNGSQTRSFCFVGDLVEGLVKMLESDISGPVNLGNPAENTVLELAQAVGRICGVEVRLQYGPLPGDDPSRRCPDITLAKQLLKWTPQVSLEEGLKKTKTWFASML